MGEAQHSGPDPELSSRADPRKGTNSLENDTDATPGVHFVGRLGTYKYYNMDQVVAQALTTFAKIAGVPRAACVGA